MTPRISLCVIMKTVAVGAGVCVGPSIVTGSRAEFDFSFTNTSTDPRHVNGTVSGLVEGLTDNTTSAATRVGVESYPAGIGDEPPAPFDVAFGVTGQNVFTVANGSITSAFFLSAEKSFCLSLGSLPGATCFGGGRPEQAHQQGS
jgi:hypothetical protein